MEKKHEENEEEENKIVSSYAKFNVRKEKFVNNICGRKNPFYFKGIIKNTKNGITRPTDVLIDTGADVSIIQKGLLPKDTPINLEETLVKAANGQKIEILGRAEDIEAEISGARMKIRPLVMKEHPRDYMIVGTDVIEKNKEAGSQLLMEAIQKKQVRCKGTQVNKIALEDKYKDMFKTELDQLTSCHVATHKITTAISQPMAQRNFQIPKLLENEINNQVESLIKTGIIEPSKSPWASRIVPVRKKSGEVRLCIDYRDLNKLTVKDVYPIPRIDEILDELAQATYFTTLDATKGYYQLFIEEKDREKTAFRWKGGFYQFRRMPFGLCNAPARFQRCMDEILRGVAWKFVIPYLDDIIIYSKTKVEHVEHIDKVMKLLKEAGIVLNQKKCKFFREEIEVLGNIVSKNQVKPDKNKTEAIRSFKRPVNIRELRSFLGLLNYCRGFIPELAERSRILNDMLKGETKKSIRKIEWSDEAIKIFEGLKRILSEKTKRAQPNFTKEFILTTDASEHAIGGILSQKQEDGNE